MKRTRIPTNGIELDTIEAGDPTGPLVVLCHGFPETSHSWRHQIDPLVEAGLHVLVPDQRGYGTSTAPGDVDAYGTDQLAADIVGLIEASGHESATIVGHDWGALMMWDLCRLHPERVDAAIGVSVPYTPWPAPPLTLMRAAAGDDFFYIVYFQEVGPAEAELEADVAETMRVSLWAGSGALHLAETVRLPAAGHGFLDSMRAGREIPDGLPAWLAPADLDAYVEAFEHSGFFGPVSWYRNLDADAARVADLPPPSMPTAFIGGTLDMVITSRPGYVESMDHTLPDYRGAIMLEGLGHWTQQEDPAAFNDALLTQLTAVR